ncbi:MAG: hypothetical protein K2L96_03935 [Muribaculaceae bacterium]|nr:hypothetical protein [Muribaculaceae bacterium]
MILISIPFDSIKTERTRALHTLVTKWVEYKLYRETDKDSLIELAANYYRKKGDSRRLMLSDFFRARCLLIAGQYKASILADLEAMDMASEVKDNYFLARSYELLGDNYCRSNNFEDAYRKYMTASELFSSSTKPINVQYMLVNAGKCLFSMWQYNESFALYDSVMTMATDSTLRGYVFESMVRPYLIFGRIEEAKAALDSSYALSPYWYIHNKRLPIYIAIAEGDSVALRAEQTKLEQDSSANPLDLLYSEYWMNILCDRDEEAYSILKKIHAIEADSLMELCRRGNDFKDIEKNYQLSKTNRLQGKLGHYRTWIVLAVAISLLVIIYLLLAARRKRLRMNAAVKEKEETILELMSELRNLRIEESEKSEAASDKKPDLVMMQQFNTINSVCQDYYEKRTASDRVRLSVLRDLETHLSKLASPQFIAILEDHMNKQHDGLATKLNEALPNLNERDRVLLLLSMTPLSAKAICVICGLKDKAYYYNRRRQLRAKLAASEHEYTQDILDILNGASPDPEQA